jgi:hypothetical protein
MSEWPVHSRLGVVQKLRRLGLKRAILVKQLTRVPTRPLERGTVVRLGG